MTNDMLMIMSLVICLVLTAIVAYVKGRVDQEKKDRQTYLYYVAYREHEGREKGRKEYP